MLIQLDETGNKIDCPMEAYHDDFLTDDLELLLPIYEEGTKDPISKRFIYCPYCGVKLNNTKDEPGSPNINNP